MTRAIQRGQCSPRPAPGGSCRFSTYRDCVACPPLGGLGVHDAATAAAQDSGAQIHWKPVEQAQLRLDDKTPLKWSVYQPDKKKKRQKARLRSDSWFC